MCAILNLLDTTLSWIEAYKNEYKLFIVLLS